MLLHELFQRSHAMTSGRILQLNAISTAACAVGMLAARGILYPLFGLSSPLVLDVLAVGLLAYAGALVLAAVRRPISRPVLMFFTVADGAWVVGSAIVLLSFWGDLAPLARLLVIAVAVVVEVFATLQFRAAGAGRPPMIPGAIGSR
jgi:hypothetical protein